MINRHNRMRDLPLEQREDLIHTLKARFDKNKNRHEGVDWSDVQAKLDNNAEKLLVINEMEVTGGEPDVVLYNNTHEYIFVDCSAESPKGRRSVCYDREALAGRKENKPDNSAIDMAYEMGIEILTEEQYRELQKFGIFDTKTSSWVKTLNALENKAALYFVIVATIQSLYTIIVQSLITASEVSVGF